MKNASQLLLLCNPLFLSKFHFNPTDVEPGDSTVSSCLQQIHQSSSVHTGFYQESFPTTINKPIQV
jgi:hypothetical protein